VFRGGGERGLGIGRWYFFLPTYIFFTYIQFFYLHTYIRVRGLGIGRSGTCGYVWNVSVCVMQGLQGLQGWWRCRILSLSLSLSLPPSLTLTRSHVLTRCVRSWIAGIAGIGGMAAVQNPLAARQQVAMSSVCIICICHIIICKCHIIICKCHIIICNKYMSSVCIICVCHIIMCKCHIIICKRHIIICHKYMSSVCITSSLVLECVLFL